MSSVLTFALVGALGFGVDWLLFNSLLLLDAEPRAARLIAFAVAAATTWCGNRSFTFSNRPAQPKLRQLGRYGLMAITSAVPNLAMFNGLTLLLGQSWWALQVALVAGVLTGMVSNYVISERWVFPQQAR
ncbi:GtrA family protein [Ferrimonas lipolytica]|uniref:GtrA family protein n=1 Tax=Ferrimonas lipolytica TaxID=2724191 RepID=A0A6H1UA97_9GAMM|nr:GtrA family protein [Ferrimonas lipolytica]QIZ75971.1 GtrA family protein [Ferrimonas lipolytica]